MSDRTIFASQIDEITSSARDTLGALRWHNGKLYKYVKIRNTTATVAGVAGDAVAYEAEDGVENHTVVLDLSDADSQPVPAGIIQGTIAGVHSPQVDYYGWIQLTGPFTANQTLGGSAADGGPLVLGSDKTLTKAAESDSTAVYKNVCAIANDASAKKCLAMFPH